MQRILIPMICALLCGCATSTVEHRREQRNADYQTLSPEWRALVDQGKLAVNMPSNAVHIAWGKPTRVLAGKSERGVITTWIYTTTSWDEYPFWNNNYYGYQHGLISAPVRDMDYIPRASVAAQVVFENGLVKSWSRFTPHPISRLMAQKEWSRR